MNNSAIWPLVLVLAVLTSAWGQRPDTTGPAQEATPAAEKQITLDLGGGVTMEMVLIRAGSFMMGSAEGYPDEKPVHEVTITQPFYLGKYEVTQEQCQAIMGTNPSRFKGPKNPAETLSWNDCQAFLKKLNEKLANTGKRFSLPTEAQWEYACRAGSTSRYCFGDAEDGLDDYVWYSGNSGRRTHPVGQKKPNCWGLYDMHGNVWEWCHDWYGSGYYGKSPADDPTGPTKGTPRVLRGGGWYIGPGCCRSAHRSGRTPGPRISLIGFRVTSVPADASGR